ncbi:MAG: oleate hydratase [Syntrophaceae bacterium]|nr:oleate hydratase [Syntrophaceae bacterium]
MTGNVTSKTQLYFVGGGIASLAGAVFAIRDGNIPGENIHIFETSHVAGGSLDARITPAKKIIIRGARKYNVKVFNCTWDLLSAVPSLDNPKKTMKDEFFEFNRTHKKNAKSRLIDKNRNKVDMSSWGLSLIDISQMGLLVFIPEKMIENRRIDSWFAPSFFKTNFWYVFASMFGFETWSDLVECKRYFRRFMHDFHQMVKGTAEVTTRYNQYDSTILPITEWLKEKGVDFRYECKVVDLDFKPSVNEYTVERIHYVRHGEEKEIPVKDNDFVFVTNGSMTADSRHGSMTSAPPLEKGELDGSWVLWENIIKSAKKHLFSTDDKKMINPTDFGNPYVFTDLIEKTMWVTFSVASIDKTFIELFEKATENKPGQADLVTFKDSSWLLSIHVPFNPHFAHQPHNMTVWGGYGLISFKEGDFVKKKMIECNGEEILTEICHQFGFIKELPHIIKTSNCVPSLMPYECAQFMPRKKSDRPRVIPKGSTNLAFMGQFTESGECVYLVESSVRCAQMAVYSLLGLNKKVPPVYTGAYNPLVWFRVLPTIFK